jgi:hypothetical protein
VAKADDISRKYREIYLRSQDVFEKTYRKAFDKVADQFARLVNDPNTRFYKSYRFPPSIDMKMTSIIAQFHEDVLTLTEEEISDTWRLSNTKNDKIVDNYLSTITVIKEAQKAAYYKPNLDALKAFIGRERNAQTLSDSIWKIGKQLRAELETHLGIGITNGDSAQVISRRVRQYLDNPEALFRRVRDDKGKLVASKAMREYHPGQGVYRSAYKNAMRLARTETNMAYHSADNTRWRQLDMVIGVKISLSGAHPEYNFPEICELLEGVYPKDYIFTGNHPHCLCHATPILTPSEDFFEYLRTGVKKKINPITQYPENFVKYWKENFERVSNLKNPPYIFSDNRDAIIKIVNS